MHQLQMYFLIHSNYRPLLQLANLRLQHWHAPSQHWDTLRAQAHANYKFLDLPPATQKRWGRVYVAMFLDYLGQHPDPWDSSQFHPATQQLWDHVYPNNSHVLAAKGDAVFALVRLYCLSLTSNHY